MSNESIIRETLKENGDYYPNIKIEQGYVKFRTPYFVVSTTKFKYSKDPELLASFTLRDDAIAYAKRCSSFFGSDSNYKVELRNYPLPGPYYIVIDFDKEVNDYNGNE